MRRSAEPVIPGRRARQQIPPSEPAVQSEKPRAVRRASILPTMQTVPPRVADIHIEQAIDQLERSDKGRAAARAFLALVADCGLSLDGANWRALEILCRAGSQGSQVNVRDRLSDRFPEA